MVLQIAILSKPFIPSWSALAPYLAELFLIVGIVAVLLTPFFIRKSNAATAVVAMAALAAALISILAAGADSSASSGGMRLLVSDPFSILWKAMLLIFTMGIILMWFNTTQQDMHEGDGPEFFALLLGATLGMSLMSSSANLLMLFIAVELASYSSYVLAGFRKTDKVGSEASLKYVLFGAACSSIMVYGISMLYGLYGTLQIDELGARIAVNGGGVPLALAIGGLLIGLGFKVSAVPLHFWCPDVFEGASVDVTAFLSVASKGAGLMLLLRVLMSLADGLGYHGSMLMTLSVVVGVMGAVTATVGNFAAFPQTNIKRLLAYSSIGHAGYMLCALSLLVKPDGASADWNGAAAASQAILLYLAVYLFMNLGAFMVVGLVGRAEGVWDVKGYAGLGRRNPILAVCMAAFMFSLVGLPPLAGFGAKLWVMKALADNGGWWWSLVGVIGLNTIASLYYYLRIVRMMYLTDDDRPVLTVNPAGLGVCIVCAIMLVLMLVGFSPLLNLTARHAGPRLAAPVSYSLPG